MINTLMIDGHKAIVVYDPEIDMFRGEFVGLNGGADFYASDVAGLKTEGHTSLQVYLDLCREKGIAPYKHYSGRFNVRIPPDLHATAVEAAAASQKSLNQWIAEAIEGHASAA
ncbi:type II toxin-antitoxin system HicB family antitoxin [Aquitalea pelogenes]|uniref:type II toxin-antitoxin system HicB family antitoxin n=1 Tax=Aquitalea pelogenes TaxID=1293573 RepID=UPI0035AF79CE